MHHQRALAGDGHVSRERKCEQRGVVGQRRMPHKRRHGTEEVAPHADQGEELRRVCAQTVQESSGDAAVMQRWCSGRGSARQAVLLCGVPRRGSSVGARKRLPMAAHLHTEEVGLEQEALGRCVRGEAEAAEEGCEANGDQEPRPVL